MKEMTETGFAPCNRTVDKTNRVLREIEEAHGWTPERRNQSEGPGLDPALIAGPIPGLYGFRLCPVIWTHSGWTVRDEPC
ncbi:hypothetical protein HS048_20255 [Planomonospora sp. ID91781]|uniref:hypothetical protein n=1 Tax=Planomonospora sp. ID91781 TaxID=2738135 RepID=UPI0018C354FB|nr:hypothetical protein [Planomonospora sp. ID91781]MBG0823071.1 hypothetical protein [Planomonospora sp. ID91781]